MLFREVNIWGLLSFWTCPSSGIQKTIMFWKMDLFLPSGERMGGPYPVGSVRKSRHQALALSPEDRNGSIDL
jgi:hypothetical protein